MRAKFSCGLLLLGVFCSASYAADSLFIQSLQIAGTGRPVQLETHAGQMLDPARIARDVRRLWATGWFDDIRVETSHAPDGVQLFFTLVEKPRLYLRRIEFDPKTARRPIGVERGEPVDLVVARKVAGMLRRQLVEQGYADARVEFELAPVGFQEADLRLRVLPGQRYRVKAVHFTGRMELDPEELGQVLHSTRVRRLLPGLRGVWRGWFAYPPFSERGIEADLERVRSLYISRGYLDARVAVVGVDFAGENATATIGVASGPRYRIRRTRVRGAGPGKELEPLPDGDFPTQELCRCLLAERRLAEQTGQVDFSARLEVEEAEEPAWGHLESEPDESSSQEQAQRGGAQQEQDWVELTARIETGPAYRVGRINFHGHHSFSDSTLRRALLLEEETLFDPQRLRRSLTRLNRLGFLEPMTEEDIQVTPDPDGRRLHLTLAVREKPRGGWLVSGPFGPTSVSGPFQFSVGARLPAWGQGALEFSTYYATFNLFAFLPPTLPGLSLRGQTGLMPVVALHRPYLPGQGWQSGFLLSPQLTWRETLQNYGFVRARSAVRAILEGDPATPGLALPISWRVDSAGNDGASPEPGGMLLCEARAPRWGWLRAAGLHAAEWLLASQPF